MSVERLIWHDYYDYACACIFEDKREKHRILKLRLCAEQNYKCAYCYREMILEGPSNRRQKSNLATIDHVIPKSEGGPLSYENTVAACSKCNNKRQTIPALEFYWRKYVRKEMHISENMYLKLNNEYNQYLRDEEAGSSQSLGRIEAGFDSRVSDRNKTYEQLSLL